MELRVVTYNIHKCIGRDGKYQPERIAQTLLSHTPDVVLLQEVDEAAKRSRLDRQVDVLGELLGMAHRSFFVNVTLRSGGGYGNAILSRFPIVATSNLDVTTKYKKRRSVQHAELDIDVAGTNARQRVHVFNLHLGLAQYERRMQLNTFMHSDFFTQVDHDAPVIVGGDFNDVWGNLGKHLVPRGFTGATPAPRTFPSWRPLRSLDHFYVRGHAALQNVYTSSHDLARIASDHVPLVGHVLIGPGVGAPPHHRRARTGSRHG